MDESELTSYVVTHLSEADDPNDIILDLCQKQDWSWPEAEAFVQRVRVDQEPTILRKQSPLMVAIAFALFLAGVALTGYGAYGIHLSVLRNGGMPDDLTTYFMPVLDTGVDPLEAMRPAAAPYLRYFIYFLIGPVPAIFFGVCMVAGSMLGMQKVWSAILFPSRE